MHTPRLLADVGATNLRFALCDGEIHAVSTLKGDDHASLESAIRAYLSTQQARVRHAAIAIANPVSGDEVRMTNRDWRFSIAAMRASLGLETLLIVNDFTALARSIPVLGRHELVRIGGGKPEPDAAIGLLGPGSGLGVSGLVRSGAGWRALASEGGHVSFAPTDAREIQILQYAWQRHGHVSAERLLSGPGLELIHDALRARDGLPPEPRTAAEITAAALRGDARAGEVVECFCGMLGAVAGNLALTLGALGGIYLGGGILPRLGGLFLNSIFRERFEAKGRFATYLARIPCYLITAETPALLGVNALLDEALSPAAG
ncbi:MAG: glucokinase [Candidatus Dactylopiibacterium carminicum]|uniref:Glucokinase n=1 Tax=Candidatus Dactylopiibacterium carminicum TaxID=857335 RepID=A0A272EXV4_9RHOO|nr:glucokinase [Candidatus Dactylopiibacterium carminicum]KAF7600497.1 glucokinase [Candidatus Dactylopiibacterium carminicum]PAS94935.1 MAG: glucokinase [Candidatus Dactylopiibacterium carminicum]PAS98070.1 MAG: glucokinase [Candidatus Dactylopiibacterium carminicum]